MEPASAIGIGRTVASADQIRKIEGQITARITESSMGSDSDAKLEGPGGSLGLKLLTEKYGTMTRITDTVSDSQGDPSEVNVSSNITDPALRSVEHQLVMDESTTAKVITNDLGEESVVLLNKNNELLGGVAAAEVHDASGVQLCSTFAVSENTVTQSVKTVSKRALAYPLTMNTRVGTTWYSAAWVSTNAKGYIVNANATALGRQQIAWNTHSTHIKHLKSVLGSQAYRVNYNIQEQFLCHVVGAWFPSGTYNMESWQPALPWQFIANPWDRCNRVK